MPNQPLCEVFGYPVSNFSQDANHARTNKICPYKPGMAACTKDKANDPLGVCSMWDGATPVILCPVRFLESGTIFQAVNEFLLPGVQNPRMVYEVRLVDAAGQNIGRIDGVLVGQENGTVTDFGALEIQAVYISGNIRSHFAYYIADPQNHYQTGNPAEKYPRADWLSSVKRIVHQFNAKGAILITEWGKRMALVAQSAFYRNFTLIHGIPETTPDKADIAIFLYQHVHNPIENRYNLKLEQTVYIEFGELLKRFTSIQAGNIEDFVAVLERKIRGQGNNDGSTPTNPSNPTIPGISDD